MTESVKQKSKFFGVKGKTKFLSKREIFVILLVLGLVIFGCIMVYSASCYSAEYRYKINFSFYINNFLVLRWVFLPWCFFLSLIIIY